MNPKEPYFTDEFAHAIAGVAFYSALIDHLIEFVFYTLLSPNYLTARQLVKDTPQVKQIKLMRLMLKDRFPERTAQTEAFFDRLEEARKKRNAYLHGLWDAASGKQESTVRSMRAFKEATEETVTPNKLHDVALTLWDSFRKLSELNDVWLKPDAQPPSSPQTLGRLLQQDDFPPWPLTTDQIELPEVPFSQPQPASPSDLE